MNDTGPTVLQEVSKLALEAGATARFATGNASERRVDPDQLAVIQKEPILVLTVTNSAIRQNRDAAYMLAGQNQDTAGQAAAATLSLAWARRWSDLKRRLPDAQVQLADALDTAGSVQRTLGNLDGARQHLEEALAVRRSLPIENVYRQAFSSLERLAGVEVDFGRLDRAAELLRAALTDARNVTENARTAGSPIEAILLATAAYPSSIHTLLGSILETEGRYAEALTQYRQAQKQARSFVRTLEEQARRDPEFRTFAEGQAHAVLIARPAEVLLRAQLGDLAGTREELRALAAELIEAKTNDVRAAATLLFKLASLDMKVGQFKPAASSLQLALDIFDSMGYVDGTIATRLALASMLERQGNVADATGHAVAALALAEGTQHRRWIGRAATTAVRLHVRERGAAGSSNLLGLLATHFDALSPEEQAAALVAQGRVEEARGQVGAARSLYDRAAQLLETLRVDPLAQEGFYDAGARHEPYEHLIALAIRRGDPEDALRCLYRSRRHDLQAAHNPSAFTSSRPELQPLLDQGRMLHAQIKSQTAALARLRSGRTPDISAVASAEEGLNKAVAEWRALSERIVSLEPGYRAYVGGEAPALRDVQRTLDPSTALVIYTAPLDTELSIVVITADAATIHRSPVPPTQVWALTEGATSALKRPQRDMDRTWESLTALHNALIAPIETRLSGVSRLQILPTRHLHYLPFQALARRTAGGMRYLIEDKEVVYISGAAIGALGQPVAALSTAPLSLALFGNATEDLPAAEGEIQGIKSLFPEARAFIRGSASADEVRAAAAQAAVLHFAVHGTVVPTLPASSYLQLAPKGETGYFTVGDIRALPLGPARLVTLSACQSSLAQGDPRGVAASSLSDAFIAAGASTVIGTLWKVNDDSSSELMIEFYRRLARGECKGAALRSAQLALLRGARFAHPNDWAAFQLTGDFGGLMGGSTSCSAQPR